MRPPQYSGCTGSIWDNDRGDRWSQPKTNTSFISHLIIERINCVNFLKKKCLSQQQPEARWQLWAMETEHAGRGRWCARESVSQRLGWQRQLALRRLLFTVNDHRRCQSLVLGLSQCHNCPFIHLHPRSQGHFRSLGLNSCLWIVRGSLEKSLGTGEFKPNTPPNVVK